MSVSKVMIVDDSPVDLAYLTKIITSAGYNVVTATDGAEAYTKAKQHRPDLIFMDIIMDGTDGYAACREITADTETCNIPIIFVTSKNQKADRVWAELQGGRAMLTKPVTSEQILEQIGAV